MQGIRKENVFVNLILTYKLQCYIIKHCFIKFVEEYSGQNLAYYQFYKHFGGRCSNASHMQNVHYSFSKYFIDTMVTTE